MLRKIGIRNSIIYICCLLIVYFTFIFTLPVKTKRAEFSTYDDKISYRGIYFATEHKIYDQSIESLGKLNVENGSKVGKGVKISDTLSSDIVGMLIYNLDGYENKYNIDSVKSLTLSEMDKMISNKDVIPGLKIIENETFHLYVYTGKDGSFKNGQKFYVTIGNNKYMCQVEYITSKKEGNFLALRPLEDIDYKNLHRGVTGDIIKSNYKGILVPSDSIRMKGNKYTIFVKMPDGYAGLKEVNVAYDDGKNAVVTSSGSKSIQQYDEIIIDPPKFLKDGTKVK